MIFLTSESLLHYFYHTYILLPRNLIQKRENKTNYDKTSGNHSENTFPILSPQ